ncbi:MAG TPA: 3-oxoacyl-[acyl-carrier-protein] synthase III C-terminal domain-containing protein, partial [Methylomirabilota bacterium]|nr:3-oxoacyl-[acyl-carrier-protein] synthase III C-terminal domain-containing protein [Methylomirabilota bacterium]
MIGIVSVGAYVPRYRLSGKLLGGVWGATGGGGERAVANYDEDSLTMASEAALNALEGQDRRRVGACFLASTTPPYLEKSNATILATVADLGPEVLTADVGGSLRCGTTALRLALDMVKAGSVPQALVSTADIRPVAPGTPEETLLGDGAGAVLVGGEDLIATFEGGYGTSREFTDVWRGQGDRYLNILPDMTFVRAHGFDKFIPEAVEGALKATGRKREDIAKVVLYAPDPRTHAALLKQLKFADSAMPKEPVIGRAGNTGSASCLLGLAAALDECRPGDQVLVVSYGSGAEALLFQCTDRLASRPIHRPVSAQLAAGRPLAQYGKYLNFRRHVET